MVGQHLKLVWNWREMWDTPLLHLFHTLTRNASVRDTPSLPVFYTSAYTYFKPVLHLDSWRVVECMEEGCKVMYHQCNWILILIYLSRLLSILRGPGKTQDPSSPSPSLPPCMQGQSNSFPALSVMKWASQNHFPPHVWILSFALSSHSWPVKPFSALYKDVCSGIMKM